MSAVTTAMHALAGQARPATLVNLQRSIDRILADDRRNPAGGSSFGGSRPRSVEAWREPPGALATPESAGRRDDSIASLSRERILN